MSSPVAKLQAYDLSIPEPTPVVRCVLLLYEQGTQSRRPCHAGLNKHPTAKCFNFPPEYNSGPWVSAQLTDEFFAYVYANQENGLMVRQLSKLRQQIITSLQELLKHWGKPLGDSEAMNLLLSMLKVDPLSRPNACGPVLAEWLAEPLAKAPNTRRHVRAMGHRESLEAGADDSKPSEDDCAECGVRTLTLIGFSDEECIFGALDKDAGRMVAIKKIHSVFSNKINCKRILREVAILQRLDHPYIVQLHDVILPHEETFDELYMVMELGDADVKTLCRQQVHLELLQVKFVLYHLLVGLKYLHSAGIYHRDLKPSNVLVNQDCNVKICDFGLARAVGEELDDQDAEHGDKAVRIMTQHVVTRYYRAPELILLDNYTEAIDLWSVGCIAFELAEMMEPKPPEDRGPLFPGSTCYPLSPDCQHRHDVAFHSGGCKEQLNMIFEVIGTPSERDVELLSREDARKYIRCFQPRLGCGVQPRLPNAAPDMVETIEALLRFNPQERSTVEEALGHPLFADIRDPVKEVLASGYITLEFDQEPDLSEQQLRQCFKQEIHNFRRARAGR
ncbi:MPK1 [Symbiodinium pilosum]|uniref:MPK1 protein n=1 Tax=Symbiodinium pilosum TaxID=2952 RepID=A0A812LGK6_SYMPI|nr:MPK1 [Symbiodinium pilosum]